MKKYNKLVKYLGVLFLAGIFISAVYLTREEKPAVTAVSPELKSRLEIYAEKYRLKAEAGDEFAYLDYADTLRQLGKTEEALTALNTAEKRFEGFGKTIDFKRAHLRALGEVDPKAARLGYTEAFKSFPTNIELRMDYISFVTTHGTKEELVLAKDEAYKATGDIRFNEIHE